MLVNLFDTVSEHHRNGDSVVRVTTKTWTGLDYRLESIVDSLIDCKNKYRTVIEHFAQMNQLQFNRCFIFIT